LPTGIEAGRYDVKTANEGVIVPAWKKGADFIRVGTIFFQYMSRKLFRGIFQSFASLKLESFGGFDSYRLSSLLPRSQNPNDNNPVPVERKELIYCYSMNFSDNFPGSRICPIQRHLFIVAHCVLKLRT
jgi:hypothetical protein